MGVNTMNEIKRLQKLAGILKEEEDFNVKAPIEWAVGNTITPDMWNDDKDFSEESEDWIIDSVNGNIVTLTQPWNDEEWNLTLDDLNSFLKKPL